MNRSEWILVSLVAVAALLMLTLASPEPIEVARALAQSTRLAAEGLAQRPEATPVPVATPTPLPTLALPTVRPTAVPTSTPSVTPTPTATPFPFDTHTELDRYIYVDQMTQMMYIFAHGELYREIPVSTGLPTSTTYTEAWEGHVGKYWGTFQAFGVYADEAWYLYRSLGSILVHSLPYNYVDGEKVYDDRETLGVRPSSHGCIRLAPEDAAWFTEWDPEGVLMTITDPYVEHWQALN